MSKKNRTEVELMVICDYAIISKENKLNILGIFEWIGVNNLPTIHAQLFLVATIKGEPNSKHVIETKVNSPSGKIVAESKSDSKFGENGKTNFISSHVGMPIEEEGFYQFSLIVDGIQVGERRIESINLGGRREPSRKQTGTGLSN